MRIMNSFPSIDLKEIYGILTIFLQYMYMGILHMLPQIWKVRIKLKTKITVITFEYVKKRNCANISTEKFVNPI
jgi:isoprenylcysteine carboxyl methyltransferase (ICMT) family protein YpbQ